MNYISATDLRNNSADIIQSLKDGEEFVLLHRSKVVGEIKPKNNSHPTKTFNFSEFKGIMLELRPVPRLSDKERERRYRNHLEKKYGKAIP